MNFESPGYTLKFIQKDRCQDSSAHLFSLIYKFRSPVTRYWYILRAEYHQEDVFSLKFYCKKDRGSEYKYSKIVNKGDVLNILFTCAKAVPLLLEAYPTASFGFVGARTIDKRTGKVEPHHNNQRFRVYKNIIAQTFGTVTFQHIEYPEISGYMLLNKQSGDITSRENAIKNMFFQTYQNLPDI